MSIQITTTTNELRRMVNIECTISDYLHSRRQLDNYIRTGLRMCPDSVQITIKKDKEN